MKMHEHDQELIMALAEGTLDTAAATAAETALAGCDECVRDLELQRVAIEALHDSPAVYLSATESARLHKALKDELSLAAAVTRRPNVAWGRWAGLAMGAAAMFFGAVLVLPALFGGEDDSATVAFEEVQDRAATESATTAAAAATTAAPSAAMAPSIDFDDALESGDGTTGAADSVAAATTTAAAAGAGIPAYEIDGDLTEELRSEIVDRLMDDPATFALSDDVAKNFAPGLHVCLGELVSEAIPDNAEAQVLGTVIGEDGQERLLVVYITPGLEDSVIVALDLPGCTVYQTIP
jgi:hypothetical protein